MRRAGFLLLAVVLVLMALRASAQGELGTPVPDPIMDLTHQITGLGNAAVRLPLAALLGAALAFRVRRSGTPPRKAVVIQTQILLAIVGAIVMLVVGQSLARAFGIVGVASLIRYRAKIQDPKDAGVMLACLGIGLASGVGLYLIAIFATGFRVAFLWWVEGLEPEAMQRFTLTVETKDHDALRTKLEQLLRRYRVRFEMRALTETQLTYEVALPLDQRTDVISNAIAALNGGEPSAVQWEAKKSD
jgi:uncharacterized membrane protein YhiD involved in acid resistance